MSSSADNVARLHDGRVGCWNTRTVDIQPTDKYLLSFYEICTSPDLGVYVHLQSLSSNRNIVYIGLKMIFKAAQHVRPSNVLSHLL